MKTRCKSLTDAQRQKLAIAMDDIIFMIPEDVSVVLDEDGEFGAISVPTLHTQVENTE